MNNPNEEQQNSNKPIPLVTLENIRLINIDNPIFTDDIKSKINEIIDKLNRYTFTGTVLLERMTKNEVDEINSRLNEINLFLENKVLNVNDILEKQQPQPKNSIFNSYLRFPALRAMRRFEGVAHRVTHGKPPTIQQISNNVKKILNKKGGKYTKKGKHKPKKRNTKKRYSSLKL